LPSIDSTRGCDRVSEEGTFDVSSTFWILAAFARLVAWVPFEVEIERITAFDGIALRRAQVGIVFFEVDEGKVLTLGSVKGRSINHMSQVVVNVSITHAMVAAFRSEYCLTYPLGVGAVLAALDNADRATNSEAQSIFGLGPQPAGRGAHAAARS
jgi:hypothetical protein